MSLSSRSFHSVNFWPRFQKSVKRLCRFLTILRKSKNFREKSMGKCQLLGSVQTQISWQLTRCFDSVFVWTCDLFWSIYNVGMKWMSWQVLQFTCNNFWPGSKIGRGKNPKNGIFKKKSWNFGQILYGKIWPKFQLFFLKIPFFGFLPLPIFDLGQKLLQVKCKGRPSV